MAKTTRKRTTRKKTTTKKAAPKPVAKKTIEKVEPKEIAATEEKKTEATTTKETPKAEQMKNNFMYFELGFRTCMTMRDFIGGEMDKEELKKEVKEMAEDILSKYKR